MKKYIILLGFFLVSFNIFAQQKSLTANVYDGVTFVPIEGANIFNITTDKYSFTNKEGSFSISCKSGDTIIISKSIYRQMIVVITNDIFNRINEDFFLYYRAILLREVNVIALNPTYEGFKRDLAQIKLPEIYTKISGTELSKQDIANAEYENKGPNVLRNTVASSPITYLYDKYSHKAKMLRLYNEMLEYEDDIEQVPLKYNKKIVKEITGISDEDIMEFMVFCKFSYYDLIKWSPTQVINMIKQKYDEYEFYKIQNKE